MDSESHHLSSLKSPKMFGKLHIFSRAGVLLKYCRIPEVNAAAKQELRKEEPKKRFTNDHWQYGPEN